MVSKNVAYDKIKKCLESSENVYQLNTGHRMAWQFYDKYKDDVMFDSLDTIYWIKLDPLMEGISNEEE